MTAGDDRTGGPPGGADAATPDLAATPDPGGRRSALRSIGYEIFIAGVSLLSILNLVLRYAVKDPTLDTVLILMNAVLSVILFIDFLTRLRTAPSRSDYFWRQYGWADLIASLPLEQLKVLRFFRLARVYRLLRDYGGRNIARSLLRDRAGSALYLLLFTALLVLEFGSLIMLRLEGTSPDANITTASDALWYVIVTMSTVGYGDQYPVTNAGRTLGAIIIVLGVGIFGTLTGYLANLFTGDSDQATQPSPDATGATTGDATGDATGAPSGAVPENDVIAHLAALRALAEQQQAQIERLERRLTAEPATAAAVESGGQAAGLPDDPDG